MGKVIEAPVVETAKLLLQSLNDSRAADDFCRALVHSVFKDGNAMGACIGEMTNQATLKIVGKYGYDVSMENKDDSISIWEIGAVTDAIRNGEPLLIQDRKEHEERYSKTLIAGIPGEGFLAIPLMNGIEPEGGLAIVFRDPLPDMIRDPELLKLLELVGSVAIKSLWTQAPRKVAQQAPAGATPTTNEISDPQYLTHRQKRVLELICEGSTNHQIGRALNLSESSIKQETVKIFRKLGVPNRNEAGRLARELGIVEVRKQDLPDLKSLSASALSALRY
jgi:DNA-binding CsgD family transcriptional regulator